MTVINIFETELDRNAHDPISCSLDLRGVSCDSCLSLNQAESRITLSFPGSVFHFDDDKKRILKTKANYRHDPLIHRVPPEIASQIFISYLNDIIVSEESFSRESNPSLRAPLLLASVCHTWRNIALSTPQLWTSIHVQLSASSKISVLTELTKQWLHRTGQLPLFISLSFADTYLTHTIEPLFDLIRECSPRWRHLTLRISAIYYKKLIRGLKVLPSLEEVVLHPPTESIWSSMESFGIGHTPALRHLAVSNMSLSKVPIDWALLTTFEASDVFLADIMGLLRTAPRLVRCKLARISGSIGIFPLPTEPIVHDALRELSIHPDGDITAKLDLLLARLVLPHLVRLECDYSGSRDALPVDSLCALFARSQCALAYFSVRVTEPDTRMTAAGLVRILGSVQSLTHLSIFAQCAVPILSDTLLERLSRALPGSGQGADMFLPRLNGLEFVGRRTFSWSALAHLFSSGPALATECSVNNEEVYYRPIAQVQIKISHHPSDPLELLQKDVRYQLLHARKAGVCLDIVDSEGIDVLLG